MPRKSSQTNTPSQTRTSGNTGTTTYTGSTYSAVGYGTYRTSSGKIGVRHTKKK